MTDWYDFLPPLTPDEEERLRREKLARDLIAGNPNPDFTPVTMDDLYDTGSTNVTGGAELTPDEQRVRDIEAAFNEPNPNSSPEVLKNAALSVPRGAAEAAINYVRSARQGDLVTHNTFEPPDPVDAAFPQATKTITDMLPNPTGRGSTVGRAVGRAIGDPASYLGPGGPLTNLGISAGFGTGIDLTKEAIDHAIAGPEIAKPYQETKPFEVPDWLRAGMELISPSSASAAGGDWEGPMKPSRKYEFVFEPRVASIVTPGGPAETKQSEIYLLGGTVAATLGAAFLPYVWNRVKYGVLPRLNPNWGQPAVRGADAEWRTVRNAAPGTEAMSTREDWARTFDDVNRGMLRMSDRAGIPVQVQERLEQMAPLETRMQAQAFGDAATIGGHAESPNFRFHVNTPLYDLQQIETPNAQRYQILRDTLDDINAHDTQRQLYPNRFRNRPQTGPTTIRGMTLQDVTREMHALEHLEPTVIDYSNGFRENLREARRFASTGELSTMSGADNQLLNRDRGNTVPFSKGDLFNIPERLVHEPGKRTLDSHIERGSPTSDLANHIRTLIRERMENEFKMTYIEAMQQVNPNSFVEVTAAQLKRNDAWKDQVVTGYRRGEKKYYTTDPYLADVMRFDPYYINSLGMVTSAVYNTKRFMEATTTGRWNPPFALVSFARNHEIIKPSVPRGMSAPNILQSIAAVPQQLYPQLAQWISQSIERGSLGYLGDLLPSRAHLDAFATRMAHTYDQSLYAQMQRYGGIKGAWMEPTTAQTHAYRSAKVRLRQWYRDVQQGPITGPLVLPVDALVGLGRIINHVTEAAHSGPAFAFARRNRAGHNMEDVYLASRRITGDNRTTGQAYITPGKRGEARMIRFESGDPWNTPYGLVSHMIDGVVGGYGQLTEMGRIGIPWFNPTMQGMKQIGESYLRNPMAFTGRAWLYTMMPAAATYLLSRSLGKDPNGVNYVDHMMNRRSEYNKTMSFYLPIPGRPAEDGIEIPRFHELALAARMMEASMDHLFRSNIYDEAGDFSRAFHSFVDVGITPPVPSIFSVWDATHGIVSTGGPFSGEFYKRRTQAYDQNGGLPGNIELIIRALAPGLGDVVGSGAAAFIQTPGEDGLLQSFINAGKEGGKRMVSKSPIIRNATGILPPMAGNTATTEQLFAKQKVLRNLEEYYKTWVKQGGQIGLKPRSKAGEKIAEEVLGERLPTQAAGLSQPEPTNPLYLQFMDEIHNKFQKDAPKTNEGPARGSDTVNKATGQPLNMDAKHVAERDRRRAQWEELEQLRRAQDPTYDPTNQGGIGFLSLWNRYGIASRNLQRLRSINEGNYVTWQHELEQKPGVRRYLQEQGVDPANLREVRNFYEKVRQDASKVILKTIKEVEEDMSRRYGAPIKIEDLDPYGKGVQPGKGPTQITVNPEPAMGLFPAEQSPEIELYKPY